MASNMYQRATPEHSAPADGAIPRYRFLQPLASGEVTLADASDYTSRVSTGEYTDGQEASFNVAGEYALVEAGGAFTDGALLKSDGTGRAIVCPAGSKPVAEYIAKKGDGTIAAGAIVTVLLGTQTPESA